MPDPIKTESEVSFKEPVSVIFETKESIKRTWPSAAALDFFKWLIGTVVLGVAGNIISCRYNDTRLELERMEADSKLIAAVSAKFDTLPSVQLSYMKYIKPFITTPLLIKGVNQNIDTLILAVHYQVKDSKSEVISAKQDAFKALNQTEIAKFKQLANVDTTKGSKPVNQISMNEVIHQEDKILEKNTAPIIPIDAKAISNIDAAYVILTPKTNDTYILIGSPQTLWCKKGYFIEFNNTLRIGINDLIVSDQTIIVNLKDIGVDADNPPLIKDNITIAAGQTFTENWNAYRYLITLNYIGAAGRNPFTKAAYITVATYKKN
jgi:hypothetical protein